MTTVIASFIAIVSTTALIAQWFWLIWRELNTKQKAVNAAKCQLSASRQEYLRLRDGPEEEQARGILERSQSIYKQSVRLYNDTLQKSLHIVPAFFLGFRRKFDDIEKPIK
ncbi:hypothetical protein CLNEO_25120 [Anaerotignum neopropionicum]|uniref:LemA family protein n=1 Tax=Anaerotignum neopropionicum TaxID=36847 RepID=A0A136WCC5_9FIRM|nr:hypothetical protein [Anaerotignum neopropionicum]KXL52163.1 hypothetical protein CLNEO_25120 [Anaerotignum neopropionicum]